MTTNDKTSEDPRQSLEGAVLYWLQQGHHRLRLSILHALREEGVDLSAAQWELLWPLWQRDGISQTELARATGRDNAGITRLVDGLEKRGLVERRRPGGDRRRHAVHLTPAGRRLHRRLLPITGRLAEKALAGLDPTERRNLHAALRQVYANLR